MKMKIRARAKKEVVDGEEEEDGEDEIRTPNHPYHPSHSPPRKAPYRPSSALLLVVLLSLLCQGRCEWHDGEEDLISPTPPHMGPAEGR
ncbi:hypothetical protein E2C01_053403 [Portunus trituberculatus]|uniref:Uncharacterized protein n=1 Tax=Portunus trituberculatus TaxID=210409 RepID=A0A5B7GRY8_PORTR|nr:hypothetical protein [Portunus trituberculatus]